MEKYRKFLDRLTTVTLVVLGLLSLFCAGATLPMVGFLTDIEPWERLIPPLSLSLAVLSLCRILSLWQQEHLTGGTLIPPLLLGLASAAVLPLTARTPFLYRGYVFPCLVGLTLPRVLLSLLPSGKSKRRSGRITFAAIGVLLCGVLLLSLAALLFLDPLSRALLIRAVLLPLMLLAQCFAFLGGRASLTTGPTAITAGLLPFAHLLALRSLDRFALFPFLFLLFTAVFVCDRISCRKRCR